MTIKRLLCLFCVLWLIPCAALADKESELDETLAAIFPRYKTVGAVVVVAKDGEIVYHYDYGYAHKKNKEPITSDTYFKTASVTKLISAIRVMQLVEEGLLDLDAPIGDYLGFTVRNPRFKETPVTLRQLMTHTSSICQGGSYSRNRPLDEFLDAKLNIWSTWETWEPGSKYKYCNFGAGLMGSLMECVTEQNINDCVREGVFQPLDIDAAYHVSLLKHPEKAAYIYEEDGTLHKSREAYLRESWDEEPNPNKHYNITIGDVWIRGDDLCRLGIMLCQEGELDGVRVLKASTVREMMASQKGKGDVKIDSPYGLCVNRVDNLLDDRMIYGHQGLSGGVLCNLYFEPESQLVFAMITNGSSTSMDHRIGKLTRRVFAEVWDVYGE